MAQHRQSGKNGEPVHPAVKQAMEREDNKPKKKPPQEPMYDSIQALMKSNKIK